MVNINANTNIYENDNAASEEEEFLTIPITTVLEADGMKKIAEAEANEQARRGLKLQEIRFNDGDSKIVRIDPTETEYKEDMRQFFEQSFAAKYADKMNRKIAEQVALQRLKLEEKLRKEGKIMMTADEEEAE